MGVETGARVTPLVMAAKTKRAPAKRRDPRENSNQPGFQLPKEQPPVTADDIRIANELVEKYGLQHLRNKR